MGNHNRKSANGKKSGHGTKNIFDTSKFKIALFPVLILILFFAIISASLNTLLLQVDLTARSLQSIPILQSIDSTLRDMSEELEKCRNEYE